jgi:lipase (class 3)
MNADSPWTYLDRSLNWRDPEFALTKAHLCGAFAEFAYLEVPEMELIGSDRLKLIPSFDLADLINTGTTHSAIELLRRWELNETFVVVTGRAIALGVATPFLIVIAIRGTAPWYSYSDWMINLNTKKIGDSLVPTPAIHCGFYEATYDLCYQLNLKLRPWLNKQLPIYITGHSLGGAMSAILYGLWRQLLPDIACVAEPTSAYIFGAPRHATAPAIDLLAPAYHIYSPKDLVPCTPPKGILHFSNGRPAFEYGLIERQLVAGSRPRRFWRGIKYHPISRYRDGLSQVTAVLPLQ